MNNLRDVQVEEIVNSQFKFIYDTIRSLKISDATPEELEEMDLNFILRHIGKIHTSPDIIERKLKRKIYIKKQLDINGNEGSN